MAESEIKGIIFDIDGTLVDSNDVHAHSWVEALAEKGYQVEFERVRSLIGKGGDKLLPEVTGLQKDSPEGEALSKRRGEIFKTKYLPKLQPLPGSRDLVKSWHEQGLKLGVATSAQEDELASLLKVARVEEFLQDKASSKDAPKSKPDPDVVQAALNKMQLTAKQVLMVGDTPYDIEAAGKAGIAAVGLRSGGWDDRYLAGAVAIFNDPADLLANSRQLFDQLTQAGRKQ